MTRECQECHAPVTHPSPYATRCDPCDLAAQHRWFAYLATLPETRGPSGDLPNPDGWITGGGPDSELRQGRAPWIA